MRIYVLEKDKEGVHLISANRIADHTYLGLDRTATHRPDWIWKDEWICRSRSKQLQAKLHLQIQIEAAPAVKVRLTTRLCWMYLMQRLHHRALGNVANSTCPNTPAPQTNPTCTSSMCLRSTIGRKNKFKKSFLFTI